jgi:aminoglycoside phosphotransferase
MFLAIACEEGPLTTVNPGEHVASSLPERLPSLLAQRLGGGEWAPVEIGMSGHEVYRVRLPDGRGAYLKIGSGMRRAELEAEQARRILLNTFMWSTSIMVYDERRTRGVSQAACCWRRGAEN